MEELEGIMKNNGDEQSILGCSSRDTASENTLSLAQPHLNRQRYGHRWGIRRPSRFSRLVGQIKKLPVRANSQMSNSQTGYSPLRPATHPSTRHERRWNGWRCTEREREREAELDGFMVEIFIYMRASLPLSLHFSSHTSK